MWQKQGVRGMNVAKIRCVGHEMADTRCVVHECDRNKVCRAETRCAVHECGKNQGGGARMWQKSGARGMHVA